MYTDTAVSPNRIRYTFYIDPVQLAALRAVKEELGVPESVQIRKAIDAWLRDRGDMKTAKRRASTRPKA